MANIRAFTKQFTYFQRIERANLHLLNGCPHHCLVEDGFSRLPIGDCLMQVALLPEVVTPTSVDVQPTVQRFRRRVGAVGCVAILHKVCYGRAVRHEDLKV